MSMEWHPAAATQMYITVILPLATPQPYTYYVPEELVSQLRFGIRVEVQFGRGAKLYTAIVIALDTPPPLGARAKPILSVIDEQPLITELQLRLWRWMAEYYCCTLGEIMHAALPANLKLSSDTIIIRGPMLGDDFRHLGEAEYLIAEALSFQDELSVEEIRKILNRRHVYTIIKGLLEKRVIYLKEDLKDKYKPKTIACVRLAEPYATRPEALREAFKRCARSERQEAALLALVQLSRRRPYVRKQDIYEAAAADSDALSALAKKGIVELYEREVSRLGGHEEQTSEAGEPSPQQARALREIEALWKEKTIILLHGATGSGKTRVYIELIQAAMARGEQVLYLLPEIALTTQIVGRLRGIFGDKIAVYHSRLGDNERVELWNAALAGKPLVLGARSALFLPFQNLGLVVVDEEHDYSYKQQDPNPRYQARDAAMYLARLHGAKALLGSATPSLESYHNAATGKYGLVEMPERFGGLRLPHIAVVDAKRELQQRKLQSHFTSVLLDELHATLERGEQAILFQNRRGYAPVYRCDTCDWHAECIHCDVSLTYHKASRQVKCHYCGYHSTLPEHCPACGAKALSLRGFGTEKIEDELKIYLPQARIGRLDLDVARGKNAFTQIIADFEERRLDVLVGTQMIAKGLDFENVGLVGILSADQLLQFPDFRAGERAFQLMTQVAGRAGRKHRRGKVLIQAFNTASPVVAEVVANDFAAFTRRELQERLAFRYPPFARLVKITLKHKQAATVNDAAKYYDHLIRKKLGDWVIGPALPYVARIRAYYLMDFLLKLEHDAEKMRFAKRVVLDAADTLTRADGFSGVRVAIDVDPF
jgi:primosomal protein N' (replication factor Y)